MKLLAAGHETIGNPVANIAIFAFFVLITLYVVIRASRRNATATEFFTADRAFSGPQNGIAIAGDYLSAASFLGIAGAIAVYGYDGFLYSVGFLVIIVKTIAGLRDSAKLLENTVELNQKILSVQTALADAQAEQTTLIQTVHELEEEITRLKAWNTEKQRYKLVEVGAGAFAYVVKPEAQGSEPEHLLCPTCYEKGKKLILQALSMAEQRGVRGDVRTCPACKTSVAVARGRFTPPTERRW